jgi:hypothetical protein
MFIRLGVHALSATTTILLTHMAPRNSNTLDHIHVLGPDWQSTLPLHHPGQTRAAVYIQWRATAASRVVRESEPLSIHTMALLCSRFESTHTQTVKCSMLLQTLIKKAVAIDMPTQG